MNPEALQQLKDIHLPAAVSWWPPAPGWWLLAALVLALLAALIWLVRKRRRALLLHRQALQALETIRQEYAQNQDAQRLAAELSALLRRVAISIQDNKDVAGLTGENWLRWLDEQWPREDFSAGAGRQLLELPYRPVAPDYDPEPLLQLVSDWISRVSRERRDV